MSLFNHLEDKGGDEVWAQLHGKGAPRTEENSNLAELSRKVETMSAKLNDLTMRSNFGASQMGAYSQDPTNVQPPPSSASPVPCPMVDPRVFLTSVQGIFDENTRLKKELDDQKELNRRCSDKICNLLLEHEHRSAGQAASAEDLLRLRDGNAELESKLTEMGTKNQRLVEQNRALRSEVFQLRNSDPNGERATAVGFMDFRACVRSIMNKLYTSIESEIHHDPVLPRVADVIRQVTQEILSDPSSVWPGDLIMPQSPISRAPPAGGGFDEIDRNSAAGSQPTCAAGQPEVSREDDPEYNSDLD